MLLTWIQKCLPNAGLCQDGASFPSGDTMAGSVTGQCSAEKRAASLSVREGGLTWVFMGYAFSNAWGTVRFVSGPSGSA